MADVFLKGLDEAQMAALYRDADIYISSSLEGEGFGLPAVEALASGVPSILTDISTYRNMDAECDFACFVPPRDPEGIAGAVVNLISDTGLRDRCIGRGLEVAANFTLRKTKADLLAFFGGLKAGGEGRS